MKPVAAGLPDGRLVVVTPVFEDTEACVRLFRELAAIADCRAYVVAVDDGSVHRPLDVGVIAAAGIDGAVIRLRRNVGHQGAIAVGLNHVVAHIGNAGRVVVMDSDGEDLPQSIGKLLQPLESPVVDVVVARRMRRVESFRFRLFYLVYKLLFSILTGRKINFGNFMALKPAAAKRIVAMRELGTHVAGCVLLSRLRIAFCPIDRGPRYAGSSSMSFVNLVLHGFKALMVFAEDVLVRVGLACALVAAFSLVGAAAAIVLKLSGYATPGWLSITLGILLLVFLQMGTLTLVTLMLTGVVRGGFVTTAGWDEVIASVTYTHADSALGAAGGLQADSGVPVREAATAA